MASREASERCGQTVKPFRAQCMLAKGHDGPHAVAAPDQEARAERCPTCKVEDRRYRYFSITRAGIARSREPVAQGWTCPDPFHTPPLDYYQHMRDHWRKRALKAEAERDQQERFKWEANERANAAERQREEANEELLMARIRAERAEAERDELKGDNADLLNDAVQDGQYVKRLRADLATLRKEVAEHVEWLGEQDQGRDRSAVDSAYCFAADHARQIPEEHE